jgi:hypothetical protein
MRTTRRAAKEEKPPGALLAARAGTPRSDRRAQAAWGCTSISSHAPWPTSFTCNLPVAGWNAEAERISKAPEVRLLADRDASFAPPQPLSPA